MRKLFPILYVFLFRLVLFIGGMFFVSGCDQSRDIDENLLTKYHHDASPNNELEATEDIDCYVDYSRGMEYGMRATSSFNEKIKNFLGGKKVTYFKVGAFVDPPIIDINSKDANFIDINNFQVPGSKLKIAVDKMANNRNKTSVFITDFERVEDAGLRQNLPNALKPHPIDAEAWAQIDFKQWLLAGNQIDIFAKQFTKPDFWFDKDKLTTNYIYTIIFTPGKIVKDTKLYQTSLLKFLKDGYQKTNGDNSRHFEYNVNSFELQQGKQNDDNGNANDNLVVEKFVSRFGIGGYEYYEFKASDLVDFNASIADDPLSDKRLINKIKISSSPSCFENVSYTIKVYDATKGFDDLYNSVNQVEPEVQEDKETGIKDTANRPIRYKFTQGAEVSNVFESVYNINSKILGIKLNPDFTGVENNTIYQINFIVNSVRLRTFPDEESVLQLNYAGDYHIKSLGESIKYAMNASAPTIQGKVLYTIYVRINK